MTVQYGSDGKLKRLQQQQNGRQPSTPAETTKQN